MPDALRPQMPKIQQVLQALGIPTLAVPSFEADDLLAPSPERPRHSAASAW